MASPCSKGHFGDSACNRSEWELIVNNSNHVFDGAGENIQYHSDSESQGSRKSKTRYINPAIYIETVEATHSVTSLQTDSYTDDVTPHPHSDYRSNSTPFLSGRDSDSSCSIKRKSCIMPPHVKVTTQKHDEEDTPRFNQTYREDGADTFRLSVASVSTTTTAKAERERNEKKKQDAFKQWLARKEQEKKEKKKMELQKRQVAAAISLEEREESFQKWLEHKRTQKERRRAEEIMRQYRENEKIETERMKRERERIEKLNSWTRKKEEEMKAMKTREERKAARAAIEEERRRSKGERAYRDWLRTSKDKPLPVPLNQGELKPEESSSDEEVNLLPKRKSSQSMRGSVSQMYINPIPWQAPT